MSKTNLANLSALLKKSREERDETARQEANELRAWEDEKGLTDSVKKEITRKFNNVMEEKGFKEKDIGVNTKARNLVNLIFRNSGVTSYTITKNEFTRNRASLYPYIRKTENSKPSLVVPISVRQLLEQIIVKQWQILVANDSPIKTYKQLEASVMNECTQNAVISELVGKIDRFDVKNDTNINKKEDQDNFLKWLSYSYDTEPSTSQWVFKGIYEGIAKIISEGYITVMVDPWVTRNEAGIISDITPNGAYRLYHTCALIPRINFPSGASQAVKTNILREPDNLKQIIGVLRTMDSTYSAGGKRSRKNQRRSRNNTLKHK